ncbi:MAG TPA: hypothetical protein VMD49_04025 [Steroidobacteraceae bacterium]|nr:hypothetical protein [Steroidobacteraceae bacterium]
MRTAITAACSLALAASLGFAATCAADPPAQVTPAASTVTAKSDPTPASAKSDPSQSSSKLAAAYKPGDPHSMVGGTCLKSTGSRIPAKKGNCLNAPGYVLTEKQIHATGATTTAGALRDLSPALTVSH